MFGALSLNMKSEKQLVAMAAIADKRAVCIQSFGCPSVVWQSSTTGWVAETNSVLSLGK